MDIDVFFRGESHWDSFLELVDLLPQEGAYYSALMGDDEIIGEMLDNDPPKVSEQQTVKPSRRGWSALRNDLADIKDILQYLIAATQHSTEPPKLIPRPETAQARWERAKKKENTDWLFGLLGLE